MLTQYIALAMEKAIYEKLENGSYYGEIPICEGVWANAPSLQECRKLLQEILEGWLVLKLRDKDPLPVMDGIRLEVEQVIEEAV